MEKAKKNWIKADEELRKESEKLLQLEQESEKKVEPVQPNTSNKTFSMSRMLSNAFETTPEQVIAHSDHPHSLTQLLTYSLIHSFTQLLTYSLTQSLTYLALLRTVSASGKRYKEEYKS